MLKKIVILVGLVSIFGCSTTPKNLVVSESDPAITQLLQVVKEISEFERKLYEIESARLLETNQGKIQEFDMYFLPSLNDYHSLGDDWSGPMEPMIELVSEMAGLNPPRFLNVKPANPIIITLNTDRRKLIDILADAGNQARSRARVTLKIKERLVQIEYSPE